MDNDWLKIINQHDMPTQISNNDPVKTWPTWVNPRPKKSLVDTTNQTSCSTSNPNTEAQFSHCNRPTLEEPTHGWKVTSRSNQLALSHRLVTGESQVIKTNYHWYTSWCQLWHKSSQPTGPVASTGNWWLMSHESTRPTDSVAPTSDWWVICLCTLCHCLNWTYMNWIRNYYLYHG